MNRYICFIGLFASLVFSAPQEALAQDQPPDCDYCKEKLHTLDALRAKLPADWTLQMEQEPVFHGKILTVQAGMEHPQTVLLVHGLGQYGFTDWVQVMTHLAQRYHVLTLDLPGFGYSDSPPGKYSPRNYAELLHWLLHRYSKGPAIVVGHSLGGAVALRFASEYPSQLDKLVLVDAAGILQRTAFVKQPVGSSLSVDEVPFFLKGTVARIKDLEDNAVDKITGLPDPTRFLRNDDAAWGDILDGHPGLNAGMSMAEENFSSAIYTLQTPTQIIWGAEDNIAPLRTGEMLARRLARAQLRIVPGAGHTPMEDPGSAAFQEILDLALATDPQPANHSEPASASTIDLRCQGKTGKTFSGDYREVRIEDCSGIKLQDVSAEHVVIRDSIIEMTNVQIHSQGIALDVINSELIATAGEISGETAIRADKSRIDLAGFKLDTSGPAVEVLRSSRLVGSANEIRSPDYTGYWQGNSKIEQAILTP